MTNTSNDSLLRLVSQLNANQFEALDDFEPSNEVEAQIVALGTKFRRQHAIIKTRETYLNHVLDLMMQIAEGAFPEAFLIEYIQDTAEDELTNAIMVALHMMAEELKAARQDLIEAHDRAIEANETKSKFLANMSHELRTPLNAIIGYTELINEDAEDDGLDHIVEDSTKILVAARHLLSLISDILDLSKIEAGKMDLYIEPFSIPGLCEQIATTIDPLAKNKNNFFDISIHPQLITMHSDQTKLRQILINILSNANKFTKDGRVGFKAEPLTVDSEDWVRFTIEDTGIGIAPERLAAIFDPFTQEDGSTTRRFGGTGLGLAISHHFSQMMGGSINVESTVGEGSTFTIDLPIFTSKEETLQTLSEVSSQPSIVPVNTNANLKILLVDDDPAVHELTRRFIEDPSVAITSAYNGQAALDLLNEEPLPDVVLLDILLPDIDGQNILAKIKTNQRLKHIPVVIISMTDDKTMAFALGASDYFVKPLDYDNLLTTLTKLLHRDAPNRVLVAEDDDSSRELVCRMLKNRGYQVFEASNGQDVIDFLQEDQPDMILLDLVMPKLDGFEVIEHIQSNPDWANIPVVIFTGMDLSKDDFSRLGPFKNDVLPKGQTTTDNLFWKVFSMIAEQQTPPPMA